MKYLLLLLLVSCAHPPVTRSFALITTTTYTCPSGYQYATDGMCHYLTPKDDFGFAYDDEVALPVKRKIVKKKKKLNCERVYKEMNMCMSGKQ